MVSAGSRGRDRGQPDRPSRTYAGAFFAYLDLPLARSYSTGLRTVTDCRFWELPAEDFGWAVREWFPMATHMLEGFAVQGMGLSRRSAPASGWSPSAPSPPASPTS